MTQAQEALRIVDAMIVRLTPPRNHTRNAIARTRRGKSCMPCSPNARSWCLLGALDAETRDGRDAVSHTICSALREAGKREYNGMALSLINDHYGHAAVLKLLSDARAQLAPLAQAEAAP